MTIKQQIEKDLGFAISPSSIVGVDYQCNACFQLAKQQQKNPMEVATEIVNKFKSTVATAAVSKPGFVNLTIADHTLNDVAQQIIKTKSVPLAKQKPRTIFFDYGGANVAKELHIGHLRPPIVGEALRRVFKAFGHKTIGDTHLGDFGLHMGLIIAELELMGGVGKNKITLELLNEIYPRASKRKETDEDFKKRAQAIVLEKQNKVEPYYSIWQKIKEVSIPKIRENYGRLNCTFDTYEGDNCEYAPEMFAALKPNTTFIDKGCVVMDVEMNAPAILKKSDGAVLYLTGDMATVHRRQKKYNPDEYIYVVDARQSLHLEQLFRAAKKGGLVDDKIKFVHVALGTVNGNDGKPFKTRAGGTVKLEDIMELVIDGARKRLAESGRTADNTTAERIGLSALKFADLMGHVKSGYIFDAEKFTDFNGKTGPYLLYTVARINSILEKSTDSKNPLSGKDCISNDVVRGVLSKIARLSDAFTAVTQNYSLNALADALFELAQEFNNFYATTNILNEPDTQKRSAYLNLCLAVKTAMQFTLDALAIDTVERM